MTEEGAADYYFDKEVKNNNQGNEEAADAPKTPQDEIPNEFYMQAIMWKILRW